MLNENFFIYTSIQKKKNQKFQETFIQIEDCQFWDQILFVSINKINQWLPSIGPTIYIHELWQMLVFFSFGLFNSSLIHSFINIHIMCICS